MAAALLSTLSANALVSGSSLDNLDGTYTYSYRIDNTAGTFDISAWSLEFPFLLPDWDPLDTFSGGDVSVPNLSWFASAGIPVSGLSAQDFLSLDPAGDVLVGNSLDGFSFVSAFAPGTIPYHEFSPLGDSASGNTVGPALRVVAVPDGGAGALIIGWLWLGSLVWVNRKQRHSVPA
jgi:hypothetical protein